MAKKITCGYCKGEITEGSKKCMHCGREFGGFKVEEQKKSFGQKKKIMLILLLVALIFISLIFLYPYFSVKYYFPNAQINDLNFFQVEAGSGCGFFGVGVTIVEYKFIDPSIGLYGGLHDTGRMDESIGSELFMEGDSGWFRAGIDKIFNTITSRATFSLVNFIPLVYLGREDRVLKGYIKTSNSIKDTLITMEKNTNLPNECFEESNFFHTKQSLEYYKENPTNPPGYKVNCNCGPFRNYEINNDGQIWELSDRVRKDCN